MLAFLQLLGTFVANLFRSRRRLEVENLFLRHQLNIALRGAPHRLRFRGNDRALLVWMTWLWPSLLGLSRVVRPDTILLIRDQDGLYGTAVTRRLRAMGIRDKPIALGSPWQNAFAERLIGSIRRECVDHMVVMGEATCGARARHGVLHSFGSTQVKS
jgi:hypothetical protein